MVSVDNPVQANLIGTGVFGDLYRTTMTEGGRLVS